MKKILLHLELEKIDSTPQIEIVQGDIPAGKSEFSEDFNDLEVHKEKLSHPKNDKSFDKLFLRDMDRNYYLTGLKNSTDSLQKTIDLLQKLSSVKKYRKKVSIGASAGGFAAILFGHLLKFSKVIAFNPQTVISEEKETIINDTFYTVDVCKKLRNLNPSDTLYQKCLNLKNLMPFKTKVEIHFSNLSEIDKNFAHFIEHENCQLIKHNSSSHLLALQLRDSKDLKDIIEKGLEI